jgi:hypothetical protein
MTAKRRILDRPRRTAAFTAEVIGLFRRLEAVPQARRETDKFYGKDYELHRLLGLADERRLSQCSIFDTERKPCWSPVYVAFESWHKCRKIRLLLLQACKGDSAHAGAVR